MELLSNLAWLAFSLSLMTAVLVAARLGRLRQPLFAALIVAGLICLVLLPPMSMSDDLLQAQQGSMPMSAQTWRAASDGASFATESLLRVVALSLPIDALTAQARVSGDAMDAMGSPMARALVRSQRLRPPLA